MTAGPLGELPDAFVDAIAQHRPAPDRPHDPDGPRWLQRLPALASEALERWDLRVDPGQPLRWGFTALVVPVLGPSQEQGALKLTWPHAEADTEHLALRAWGGHGAVRLRAADPSRHTWLLERLDAEPDLRTVPVLEGAAVIGSVLTRLDRPAPPWAPAWEPMLARLQGEAERAAADPAVAHRFPRRFLAQAASLAADLRGEPDSGRLVHTDLHQMNVLWRPDPGEWVAIDPKIIAGDPHWAVAPALWNRWDEALAAPDLASHLQGRLAALTEAAGLDHDRARAMVVLRLVQNALWSIREPRPESAAEITRAVAIVKAMQQG